MEIKFETKSESRKAYDMYVQEHINNVRSAFDIFGLELCELVIEKRNNKNISDAKSLYYKVENVLSSHDKSKYDIEEFDAYAAKFYTSKEDNLNTIESDFNKAWEHHLSENKHHPEYWCITNNNNKIILIVSMSQVSFVEMILDWISVSMCHKSSVLDWWNKSGRNEKSKLLRKSDFEIVDKWLNDNKDRLDFSS